MPADKGKIKYTEQEVLNNSFNENTALIETQIYGQDVVNDGARKIAVNTEGQLEVDIKTIPEVSIDKTGLATDTNQNLLLQELIKKTEATDAQLSELTVALRFLLVAIANPSYVDKSANAIRNQIQSGTVTTVTTLTNVGTWPGGQLSFTTSQNTWANMCRSLIT